LPYVGETSVCYEVYTPGGRPGYSFLFERGRDDGFSPEDVEMFLTVTDTVCDKVADYQFTNVTRLLWDFRLGRFAETFRPRSADDSSQGAVMPIQFAVAPALTLTTSQFQVLAAVPPEIGWFANLTNANTRRAYSRISKTSWPLRARGSLSSSVTWRAHVIAWREQLVGRGLANDTIRRKLAALSSLYTYLCDRNTVLHNPVLGVKRPRSMNREGVMPALGDH